MLTKTSFPCKKLRNASPCLGLSSLKFKSLRESKIALETQVDEYVAKLRRLVINIPLGFM